MTNTLNDPPQDTVPTASAALLRYVIVLVALSAVTQGYIVLAGNKIDLVAYILTVLMAVWFAYFPSRNRRVLALVPYGYLLTHALTYAIVNGGFQLHAAILAFVGSDSLRGGDSMPVDGGWVGPTYAMAGFWSIGLLVHAVATFALTSKSRTPGRSG